MKKPIPKDIVIKILKINDKEKILKEARKKTLQKRETKKKDIGLLIRNMYQKTDSKVTSSKY